MDLRSFVTENTIRESCKCGRCIVSGGDAEPVGEHTADLVFFKLSIKDHVSLTNQDYMQGLRDTLRKTILTQLIAEHEPTFGDSIDLFDGHEHNYIELGAWLGDQESALLLMGVGELLGFWNILSPVSMLKLTADDPLAQQMAGQGMVSIQATLVEV